MAGNVLTQEDTADVITGIDNGYIDDGYQGTKSLSEYSDPVSTGRKRAKEMYPIHAGMVCEWAGLKLAGGGVIPIKFNVSVKRVCLIFRSIGEDELRDGHTLTSISQGFNF